MQCGPVSVSVEINSNIKSFWQLQFDCIAVPVGLNCPGAGRAFLMSEQNKAGNEVCLTGGVERKNNNLCQLVMVSSNDLQEIYHTQVICSTDKYQIQ